jgi:putative hydrolase of the HAD superfamily
LASNSDSSVSSCMVLIIDTNITLFRRQTKEVGHLAFTRQLILLYLLGCQRSSGVEQRFRKPSVVSSNLTAGLVIGAMIRAAFFDFYNTLVDYDPPREVTEARVLGELGIEVEAEAMLRPLMVADDFLSKEHSRISLGKRSREEIIKLYSHYHGIILKEAGLEASPQLIGELLKRWLSTDYKMALYDDAAPALDALKERGIVLGLISNVDRDINSIYDELGLPDWLRLKITSQEVGFSKPHPAIFQAALEQANVNPEEALYVGDQYEIDVLGANGVGMKGILIDRHGFFESVTGSPRIRRLTELTDYL